MFLDLLKKQNYVWLEKNGENNDIISNYFYLNIKILPVL